MRLLTHVITSSFTLISEAAEVTSLAGKLETKNKTRFLERLKR